MNNPDGPQNLKWLFPGPYPAPLLSLKQIRTLLFVKQANQQKHNLLGTSNNTIHLISIDVVADFQIRVSQTVKVSLWVNSSRDSTYDHTEKVSIDFKYKMKHEPSPEVINTLFLTPPTTPPQTTSLYTKCGI